MPSTYIYIYLAHLAKPPCTYVNGSCTFRNSKPTVQLNTKPLPWYEGAILPKSQNTIYNSFGQNFRPKQEKQAVSILRFPISRHSIKYSLHTQSRISASNTLGRDSQITIYQFQPIDPLEHFIQGIDATITFHIGGLGCWQPEGVGYGHNSRFNPNDLFLLKWVNHLGITSSTFSSSDALVSWQLLCYRCCLPRTWGQLLQKLVAGEI